LTLQRLIEPTFVLILLHSAGTDVYANAYADVDVDVFADACVETNACIVLMLVMMLC
jgi:methylmalonyl-CoA mutase cobalamin-binding subunit